MPARTPALLFLLALSLAVSPAVAAPVADAPADRAELARELALVRRDSEAVRPGTAPAKPIAARLARIGRAYLDLGENGRALELLEEAYGLDEENGVVLAQLTLAYVKTEDYAFARFYLDLAERRAPYAPPEAYAVLGESYYALNRLEDAVLAWDHFRRLGGADPRILARLDRARQELSLSSKQRFLETENFAFFFDAVIPRETVETIAERLSRDYEEQTRFFGVRLPSSQIVLLYAGRTYFTLVSVPEWVSGVFDGKIRVAVDPDGGFTPALAGVLAHELAHALVRYASRDHAPAWLHEGLAQWWEGRRVLRGEFREGLRGAGSRSLAAVEGNLSRTADRSVARASYLESLGLVEYLVDARGPGSLACIVSDLGQGLTMDAALAQETGLTSAELLTRWRKWAGI